MRLTPMIKILPFALAVLSVQPVLAAAQPVSSASAEIKSMDPVTFLHGISDQLLMHLKQDRSKIEANPQYVYQIVDEVLVPYVDTDRMSRSVVPRSIWVAATPAQQQAFVKSFLNLVVRTYASALDAYTDQQIKYLPIRVRGAYQDQSQVQVNSQIVRSDGPPVAVVYRLAKTNGQWKVYDMTVEGISLLQSFRSQFAAEFSSMQNKQGALAALTQKLDQHNASRN